MEPFLDVATFATWAKKPGWVGDPLATSLLQLVSDWIRERKPDIAQDDPGAQVVTFEVTRDSMMYGDFGPQTAYLKATSHSQRSGTIDRAVVEKFITDRHRRMLGIGVKAAPRRRFKRFDY